MDRLSREDAVDKHDARVTDKIWAQALALAEADGMQLTVDWFADPHNHRLPRFWSRQLAVGSAGTDAFTACSWGRVKCSTCESDHDHCAWVFPLVPLIAKVVGKLKSDRAHGVALVPFRPDTTWWTSLEQACKGQGAVVPVERVGGIDLERLSEPAMMYSGVKWRLCRFDFGADRPLGYAEQCADASPWARPTISPVELGHHRRLLALMFFLDPELQQATT